MIDFPSSPNDGDRHTHGNVTYVWDANKGCWYVEGAAGPFVPLWQEDIPSSNDSYLHYTFLEPVIADNDPTNNFVNIWAHDYWSPNWPPQDNVTGVEAGGTMLGNLAWRHSAQAGTNNSGAQLSVRPLPQDLIDDPTVTTRTYYFGYGYEGNDNEVVTRVFDRNVNINGVEIGGFDSSPSTGYFRSIRDNEDTHGYGTINLNGGGAGLAITPQDTLQDNANVFRINNTSGTTIFQVRGGDLNSPNDFYGEQSIATRLKGDGRWLKAVDEARGWTTTGWVNSDRDTYGTGDKITAMNSGGKAFRHRSGGVNKWWIDHTTGNEGSSSDIRLKSEIKAMAGGALDDILQLDLINFMHNGANTTQDGVSAQDIQKVWPELVEEDENGYLGILHGQFIYKVMKALQELAAEVRGTP